MENIGKAGVSAWVGATNRLSLINKEPLKFNFDVSAWNWSSIQSYNFTPLLTERIYDDDEGFAALIPSRRQFYINNFLDGTSELVGLVNSRTPYTVWKPCEDDGVSPLVSGLLNPPESSSQIYEPFLEYELLQPDTYQSPNTVPEDYKGPVWKQEILGNIIPPNDNAEIQAFYDDAGISVEPPTATISTDKDIHYMNQTVVRDGLYWAIENSSMLRENMPFCVSIRFNRPPPSSSHPTFFVISLGIDDEENAFDIYLPMNGRASFIDYFEGRQAVSGGSPLLQKKEFDTDLSKLAADQGEVKIWVMTCAGRLVCWVNDVPAVYTRLFRGDSSATSEGGGGEGDDAGTLVECKIAAGKMRIYGSNVIAAINVCPMIFAPISICSIPVPSVLKEDETVEDIPYRGVKNDGTFEGPVCILPQQPDDPSTLYGVDCRQFISSSGNASPEGFGMHQLGRIYFLKRSDAGITTLPDADYYILVMRPDDVTFTTGDGDLTIEKAGCPYFFRLKGGAQKEPSIGGEETIPITDYIISATESASAPDYFHAEATASITLYNKGGMFDYLKIGQRGIKIRWGWDGAETQTFKGIVMSASSGETAGMETLTLQCEDYMQVLKNTPIVNSPFYDGMVAVKALIDLAERAGVVAFISSWPDDNEEDYFLPSGYTFSKPVMRFPAKQSIYDCMINILQRFEAFMYFDNYGFMNIRRLPGGLFSNDEEAGISGSYFRDPLSSPSNIILDEKQVEYNFASTVNRINIWTLNRDTRASVLFTKSAIGNQDRVVYRKLHLVDQAALGDIETARTWAERLSQRIFYPIRKSSFKTVGYGDDINLLFDFVEVDGEEYRVMGVKRDYSADSNSITCEYNVEWLGGE